MNYHNPLSIFSESQLQHIYDGNLKAVKKELMLQFQLEESVTLNLNGKELDKNGVIKFLEEIESDLGLQVEIFKNKNLLHFLEDGDLKLFEYEVSADDEVDEKYYEQIIDMIIRKLNHITGKCASQTSFKSNKKLKTIFKFTHSLEPYQQTQAYQLAYEIIDQKVRKTRSSFSTPFKPNNRHSFHPEIHKLVDSSFYNQFQYLPPHFENAKRTYGVWCNNVVVAEPLENKARLRDFDKETLRTIARAAEIASNHYNAAGNRSIVRNINEYLSPNTNISGISIFFFIMFAFFKIAVFMSKSSKTNISDYSVTIPKSNKNNSIATYNKINYNKGYFKASPQIDEYENYTELTYETTLLPSQLKDNYLKIPSEIKTKYAGSKRELRLTFQDTNFPKVQLKYRTLFDFRQNYFTYDLIESQEINYPVTLKSYPTAFKKMEVNISRMNTSTFQAVSEKKYYISYKDGQSQITEGNNNIKPNSKYATQKGSNDSTQLVKIFKILDDLDNYEIKNAEQLFKNYHRNATLTSKGIQKEFCLTLTSPDYNGLGIIDQATQKLNYYQAVIPRGLTNIDVIKVVFK